MDRKLIGRWLGTGLLAAGSVCTPVFDDAQESILFWVASRGHHADVGGVARGDPDHDMGPKGGITAIGGDAQKTRAGNLDGDHGCTP